ncbi:hypothetical protein NPS01_13610 [Nocardioides psychrotolerans]|uniref:Uncharacterized protein n=1 Tax=Nocardioides psychrotolerans TaxID=1005945 RepID=A0A1I3H959_9ACTN|nr:hypothetical protein NPS01_13610 [Nocardioides psychrotolerans]SFI32244.1 hypothetical protein SAMN05216561_10784 [Nocardioides psychrotolerans]
MPGPRSRGLVGTRSTPPWRPVLVTMVNEVGIVLAGFVSGGLSLQDAVDHPRVHLHRVGQ